MSQEGTCCTQCLIFKRKEQNPINDPDVGAFPWMICVILAERQEENALEWKNAFEGVLFLSFYTVFSFLSIFRSTR